MIEIFLDETRNDARGEGSRRDSRARRRARHRVPTKRLDGFYGGGRHQGVVARVEVKNVLDDLNQILEQADNPLLLVLDGVTDPHNLGACLRVANAAGAHAVIAPRDRAAGITPVVSKVASGAAEATPYLMVTNLARTLAELKERNIWVVGAEEGAGKTLYEADLTSSIRLGPRCRRRGHAAPHAGKPRPARAHPNAGRSFESLNVAVSAGICLFESVRRRR